MAQRSDLELLEDLLARENRLLSAYEAALRRDAIDPAVGELLRDHEREHVRALEQTLAGYTEATAAIGRPGLRQPLGSIMCCGAAHVVALRQSLGYRSLVPYPGG